MLCVFIFSLFVLMDCVYRCTIYATIFNVALNHPMFTSPCSSFLNLSSSPTPRLLNPPFCGIGHPHFTLKFTTTHYAPPSFYLLPLSSMVDACSMDSFTKTRNPPPLQALGLHRITCLTSSSSSPPPTCASHCLTIVFHLICCCGCIRTCPFLHLPGIFHVLSSSCH